MASRNFADVAPTAATIALNAYIYGYGGHSLVTPHAALKRLWWTDERIDAKITRSFVISKLRGEERDFLDKPLAFGEGLTDDTYMEWVLERAKRLFLILAECGVPDQIFGCIDDSWDDEDLPLSLENVQKLELSYENDDALNKKFYDMQFVYLLRELKEGAHIDYGAKEHIPMEHVNTVPPAVSLQPYDRVHFPGRPDDVFARRKFAMSDRDTGKKTFMRDLKIAKALPHEHIAPVFATYTSQDSGFVLSSFVPEHTLKTFIEHRSPPQFMRVSATERPILLMEWMHCLADALASLHHRNVAHTQIRPSNVWINKNNKIAFADIGSIPTLQRNKKSPRTEAYDYAAPEQHITRTPITLKSSSPPISSMNAFSRLRKMNSVSISDSSSSTSGSSGGSSTRNNSISIPSTPISPPMGNTRSNSISTIRTALSPTKGDNGPQSPNSIRNFSRHITCPSPTIPTGPGPQSPTFSDHSHSLFLSPVPTIIDPSTLSDLPKATSQMSDIFSLACIYLDILTFILKGKNSDFIKFRSSRVTTPQYSSTPSSRDQKAKSRLDTSFHSSPDKILAWIDLLGEDSYRHQPQIFRGIPALLALIRTMLSQNATLRPTALQVRDRIQTILSEECEVEVLCCKGRQWADLGELGKDEGESTRSPFRRHSKEDDFSISPASPTSVASPVTGPTAANSRVTTTSEPARCSTSYGERGRPGNVEIDVEKMSLRSVVRSGGRRRSSTSTSTATASASASAPPGRLSSWRRFIRH